MNTNFPQGYRQCLPRFLHRRRIANSCHDDSPICSLFIPYPISIQLTKVVPGRWSCVRRFWRRSRLLLGTHVPIRVVCTSPSFQPLPANLDDEALLSGAVAPLCRSINGSSPSEYCLQPSSIMLLKLAITTRLTVFRFPCNSSGQSFLLEAWPSCPSPPDGLFGRVAMRMLPSPSR